MDAHENVPHFAVTTTEGTLARYRDIWQHRHLVLVSLPGGCGSDAVAESIYVDRLRPFVGEDVALVITRDHIPGMPRPGVLVADRWGEILFVGSGASVEDLPPTEDLAEWVQYVRMKCPECEGEAR